MILTQQFYIYNQTKQITGYIIKIVLHFLKSAKQNLFQTSNTANDDDDDDNNNNVYNNIVEYKLKFK